MKKLVVLVLVAGVLFGLSAGGSWMWRHHSKPHEEEEAGHESLIATKPENMGKSKDGPVAGYAAAPQRSAVRPPYTAGADEAVQLASNLRERLAAVKERETQLAARQKQLQLIYNDIRSERSAVDELRKQVGEELKAVKEKMDAAERKKVEIEQQKQELTDKGTQMQKSVMEIEENERRNIDKMAKMYQGMEPESAARVLQQMADTGKMETAVKVLGQMQERQAAKVLSVLPEALAAQLLEKMKNLKRTTSPETSSLKQ